MGQASRPKRDRPKIVSTILHKALAYSTHTYLKLHTDEQAVESSWGSVGQIYNIQVLQEAHLKSGENVAQ